MAVGPAILLAWFAILAMAQVALTGRLWKAFHPRAARRGFGASTADDDPHPETLVLLCLRGTDPFLPECLRRLSRMDHLRYTLRIVIDSETDPVHDLVQAFLEEDRPRHVEVMVPSGRLMSCSGKVNSILHATEHLPSSVRYVAVFDGDAMVHPGCLTELIQPLQNPVIGMTTGNRWYWPRTASAGSMNRYLWNAYAVPVMNFAGIPWGGCMALRAGDFRDARFRKHLAEAFTEDLALGTFIRRSGRQVFFVPTAIIPNREEIGLRSFENFLLRQFLTVRLGDPRWPLVVGHMLLLNATLQLTVFLIAAGLVVPRLMPWDYLAVMATGLGAVTSIVAIEVLLGELLARKIVRGRGEPGPRWRMSQLLMFPAMLVMVNGVNLWASLRSIFVVEHVWRGVRYRFRDPECCRVIDAPPLTGASPRKPSPGSAALVTACSAPSGESSA